MHVLLLERISGLGQMGDKVRVKDGYARNFLLPKGKALPLTEESIAYFAQKRQSLEAQNLERRKEAEALLPSFSDVQIVMIRQASEAGFLYGSVTGRAIAVALAEKGISVSHTQIVLPRPIKTLGLHKIDITLHPEVLTSIVVNIARSQEEAARQAGAEETDSPSPISSEGSEEEDAESDMTED